MKATNPSYQRSAFRALDRFVDQYMHAMKSPGMTLVLADRSGVLRTCTYGSRDLDGKVAVDPDELFHIGSIGKSLTAIAILQLMDEGKLDLSTPLSCYLPWAKIETPYQPITIHHLLTHTSGLPRTVPVFLSDSRARHTPGFAPGKYFYYSNLGYDLLGYLISTLDRRSYAESIQRRILEPLGMHSTAPGITPDTYHRTIPSYTVDRVGLSYNRHGTLRQAPVLICTKASASIASTAGDMGIFINMLLNRGEGLRERILSERSFGLLVNPFVKAEGFGPTACYGYGLAIDQMDEHRIARHTGGTVSFMSSLQVDLDGGIGVFASINSMQGYRPDPVTNYALRVLRAQQQGNPASTPLFTNRGGVIENASDYEGCFTSSSGEQLEFLADGDRLYLMYQSHFLPVEITAGSCFLVSHPDFVDCLVTFVRENGSVIEASCRGEWYMHDEYSALQSFPVCEELTPFEGHYHNDSPWLGSLTIAQRRGRLWLNGMIPLEPIRLNVFSLADIPYNPEWIQFLDVVDHHSMHLKFSGEDYWRI